MSTLQESCSVCGAGFDLTFRYQMEERDGGFLFFCSQGCLERSQAETGGVPCDGCAKRFQVTLASHVLYVAGSRKHACSMACRSLIVREAAGVRLGEAAAAASPAPRVGAPQAPTSASPPPAEGVGTTTASAAPPGGADGADRLWQSESNTAAPPPRASAAQSEPAPAGSEANGPPRAQGRPTEGNEPRCIAVFNHKGGTGKTTTSVNLAAGLADRGHRVLLVDTDSQGNVAVSLGVRADRSLYHVLVMGLRPSDAVQCVRPNLDLLPSNETLAAAELYLAGRQSRDRVLAQRLAPALGDYDFVIIDCSPSLSLMNQNALCVADSVLVPVGCDYLSLVGVRQVIKTVKNVNALLHHRLAIWGVLPTFYDARANICVEALATLRDHFGDRCLPPVRATTKLKEAPAQARSIFEHAPGTYGAEDYAAVVARVVEARGHHLDHEPSSARGRTAVAAMTAARAASSAAMSQAG